MNNPERGFARFADTFFLVIKRQRLEQDRLEQNAALRTSGVGANILAYNELSDAHHRSKHVVALCSIYYLACNMHENGRSYDRFCDPDLVGKVTKVEELLQRHVGHAVTSFKARASVLNIVERESIHSGHYLTTPGHNDFEALAVRLNQITGTQASTSDSPGRPAFDADSARELTGAVEAFHERLLDRIHAAPKSDTVFWLDDLDKNPNPELKPDCQDYNDNDYDEDVASGASPVFQRGRPSDELQRFPDGLTDPAIRSELVRLNNVINERLGPTPARQGINPIFKMRSQDPTETAKLDLAGFARRPADRERQNEGDGGDGEPARQRRRLDVRPQGDSGLGI
jgi:hypothetical protein